MSLGERIKTARDNKGLKQSELADLIDVKSSGVISNWEKDINKPDADKIIKLCEVLDISASYLLDYHGGNIDIAFEEKEMINKYRKLDPHGAKIVDLVLNEEYERCAKLQTQAAPGLKDTEIIETPKGRYKVANAAAFGGGTMDILIPADVSSEEINRLIDENESLQRQKENQKVAEELKKIIKRNK